MPQLPAVLPLYRALAGWPFGRQLFSIAFAAKAPYFRTVRPYFTELRPDYAEVRLRKRRRIHNHLRTVHVIAIANGLEAAMGALAEASIPPGRRWIPKAMQLRYTALADSDIVCTAETAGADWSAAQVSVRVTARRADGTVVVSGTIELHISDRTPGAVRPVALPAIERRPPR
ncbi:MAG: hotdog fold domain-containing protein [Jatrophihabitans sp.]